jgi:hypothetical protein
LRSLSAALGIGVVVVIASALASHPAHHAEHASAGTAAGLTIQIHNLRQPRLQDLPGSVIGAKLLLHPLHHPLTHLRRIELPARSARTTRSAGRRLGNGQTPYYQSQNTGGNPNSNHLLSHLLSPCQTNIS